jgi:hypothetical protein
MDMPPMLTMPRNAALDTKTDLFSSKQTQQVQNEEILGVDERAPWEGTYSDMVTHHRHRTTCTSAALHRDNLDAATVATHMGGWSAADPSTWRRCHVELQLQGGKQ